MGEVIIIEYFNIDNLTRKAYKVGILNQKVIDILNLNLKETDILFGADKIRYTNKHQHKFKNYNEYKRHVELVPDIIANPKYVSLHPSGESIEYIKILEEIMVVPVRYKETGVLWIKTAFPITQEKLSVYLNWGTLKEYI